MERHFPSACPWCKADQRLAACAQRECGQRGRGIRLDGGVVCQLARYTLAHETHLSASIHFPNLELFELKFNNSPMLLQWTRRDARYHFIQQRVTMNELSRETGKGAGRYFCEVLCQYSAGFFFPGIWLDAGQLQTRNIITQIITRRMSIFTLNDLFVCRHN